MPDFWCTWKKTAWHLYQMYSITENENIDSWSINYLSILSETIWTISTTHTLTFNFHPICLSFRTSHLAAANKQAEINRLNPEKIWQPK